MATTDGIDWHVTSQEQTTVPGNGPQPFIDVWQVYYKIDNGPAMGTSGYVNIPVEQYNKDIVMSTIGAQVAHLHAIGSL